MGVQKELFGSTREGKEVYLYTLSNSRGMKAKVMNYGAILVDLIVPDKDGRAADVVLGYDKLSGYFVNGCFFGAVIGPNANRIANAGFTLDGVEYHLDPNDGVNNLHSHKELGVHKRIWEVQETDNGVTFSVAMPDGDMGFPGNKTLQVTYTVNEENELKLEYRGTSDKNTIINMTNHSYFNLDGHDAGEISEHLVTIHAKYFTEIVPGAIPTGKLLPVEGTPMDFNTPRKIGEEIDKEWDQLEMVGGYDHNWCLDNYDGNVRLVAAASNPSGSRTMKVFTDLPGVQFYTSNGMAEQTGKGGANYGNRTAYCLETQFYPDTANEPDFPSAVFGPGKDYHSITIFRFE